MRTPAKFPTTFEGITNPADIDLVTRVLAEFDSAPLRAAESAVSLAFGDVDLHRTKLDEATQRLIAAERTLLRQCRHLVAEDMRVAVHHYLQGKYGVGDKTWHPLFVGARALYIHLLDEA